MSSSVERRKVPPLNLNPKPPEPETEVDLRLDSILRGMGDSARSQQPLSSAPKRPSSAVPRQANNVGSSAEQETISRQDSAVQSAEGSGRSTPAASNRGVLASGKEPVRQTPDLPERGTTGESATRGEGSGRSTPAASNISMATSGQESNRQMPDSAVESQARENLTRGGASGRNTPTASGRYDGLDETGNRLAADRQTEVQSAKIVSNIGNASLAITGRSEEQVSSAIRLGLSGAPVEGAATLMGLEPLSKGYGMKSEDPYGSISRASSAGAILTPAYQQQDLSVNNPMFDLDEDIASEEENTPRVVTNPSSANGPKAEIQSSSAQQGNLPGMRSQSTSRNETPLPSGRATATPRSGSPQVTSDRLLVTSASMQAEREATLRLDSAVQKAQGSARSHQSRTAPAGNDSARGAQNLVEDSDVEEEVVSDNEDWEGEEEETTGQVTRGITPGRPVSAVPSGKSTPLQQESVRPMSGRGVPQGSAIAAPSRPDGDVSRPNADASRPTSAVSRRNDDITPLERETWSPPVVRRPSGALGNYPPADDYGDDFEEGGGYDGDEIVEDDGPETPEDQAPPRVLNRSVQELPRESPDRSGQEPAAPVRNFGPRPASAYGPRGTSSSSGGFARKDQPSWGSADVSTSGAEVAGASMNRATGSRAGEGKSSTFADAFGSRPWSAGSAPGTGLHAGSLDEDLDRRSVDLGPVRLAKTGSFGSNRGAKGGGMSREDFRVHFEGAEPTDSEPSLSQLSSSHVSRTHASSARPASAGVGIRAREIARALQMHPTQWGVAEVCHWVEHIGHSQHRVRFAHHRIDGPLLLRLTEEQLKVDLDIRSLGQRQSIAAQIGALRESLGLASQQKRTSSPRRPASAPRMRASGDAMSASATLRDEERRGKLARELEKALTRATKARQKADVLSYTVGHAETEVERLQAELADLDTRERRRASTATRALPLWRPPGEHTATSDSFNLSADPGEWFKPHINPKSLEMLQSTEGSADFLKRMTSDLSQRALKMKEKRQAISLGWKGGYEFLEQQRVKTERFLREVLQQKLDVSVEQLTDTIVDQLLESHGGALDLTDEQQENVARARGSKRRSLLEQYLRGNEFMSRLENDQRRRDASLREYRAHLAMIDTISRNGKTHEQREQEDRRAAIAHFKELWPTWEMPAAVNSGSARATNGEEGAEPPDAVSNDLLDSLIEQALSQKQHLAKYAIVQQNEARRGLGLVLFEGEPIEARPPSGGGNYGASLHRASQSIGGRPQTAGGNREEKATGDGKVPTMQETMWMISRLKDDEIKRLKQARGEKKAMAIFRAFRAQQFVRKMELDKEIRDYKLEQKLTELRRRPKSAGNAKEFMMRLEDDLQRRKEKEQALLKQRMLSEGPPPAPLPSKVNWRK